MIKFQRKNGSYYIGGSEMPTEILCQYPHEIEENDGEILLPYSVGETVIRYPSALDRAAMTNGVKKVISEFTIFGNQLCCRFEGSNVPHSIECISPL